ncbi:MAG: heterodisulfide reductase subunit F [Rhodospirillales bacterium RIFCSPLOWO2_12_FULL_58_28]|nr:MAG: heterodisulfide reductase subunit F [Rhodospirillales bacterium RIFCSPLOWO2_02_FULL_58_16]OHC78509.1 MAG: heterodisulfide reductase subunit F [Rhodospirillales bacterium RIFCSPLOWO2_12_FULL_58_28]
MLNNIYLPKMARIVRVKQETGGPRPIKSFRTEFVNGDGFDHLPGQCAMISVFGKGEAMISISSAPHLKDYKQFSIVKTGRVTTALHGMREGDIIGLRGPLGNCFPIDDWKGKNIIIIGGGCGLAPVWPILQTTHANKKDFGDLTLFYGGRTSGDILYRDEIEELRGEVNIQLSVDAEEPGWEEYVGFVPSNLLDKKPSPDNTIAITCGPPMMIKFVIKNLQQLGFADDRIYTTVENKMKCGIGKCGRCNIGKDYVCMKGPVYSWADLKALPQEY